MKNAGSNPPRPPDYYYVVMVSHIIVSVLVITLFIASSFDVKRSSLLPEIVIRMMEGQASLQIRLDTLENNIDDLKQELEEMKRER